MTATDRKIERFVVVADPYYTSGESKFPLRDGYDNPPGIGDVVETDLDDHDGVDDDGDRAVLFNGVPHDIADAVLVSIDALIKSKADRANPIQEWERELLDGPHYSEVTLDRPVIKPAKLAAILLQHGLDGTSTELLVGLAVLRSVDDSVPTRLASAAVLRRVG